MYGHLTQEPNQLSKVHSHHGNHAPVPGPPAFVTDLGNFQDLDTCLPAYQLASLPRGVKVLCGIPFRANTHPRWEQRGGCTKLGTADSQSCSP